MYLHKKKNIYPGTVSAEGDPKSSSVWPSKTITIIKNIFFSLVRAALATGASWQVSAVRASFGKH